MTKKQRFMGTGNKEAIKVDNFVYIKAYDKRYYSCEYRHCLGHQVDQSRSS
ncbi:MAG: hypothetical protein IPH94_03645 [Saprospiraceae bacterium]|nr:hypothetical protein [Saprospiraceae bacterium]MBK9687486.1 hypothetical protein [Saprospiraceae bacterium]